jgi:hypothetical protein
MEGTGRVGGSECLGFELGPSLNGSAAMKLRRGIAVSHPKILECEINKIGTMLVCIDRNFTGN